MWHNIFQNRIVQIILAVIVVVALCWICGIGLHFNAGQGGVNLGISHGQSGEGK